MGAGRAYVLWEQKIFGAYVPPLGVPYPDGRYMALLGGTEDSNVWMLENF